MKKIIILFTISSIFTIQIPQIVNLREYYCGKGVIFDKNYKYPFFRSNYGEAYTPTLKQLKQSEDILFNDYYNYRLKVLDSFNSNFKIKGKLKEPKNVKKKFYKYYRQYAGYVDTSNDSIIHIGLFNFSNIKEASLYFDGWDRTLFSGSGEYSEKNHESYIINLSTGQIIFK
jgi:hypothetical protein